MRHKNGWLYSYSILSQGYLDDSKDFGGLHLLAFGIATDNRGTYVNSTTSLH